MNREVYKKEAKAELDELFSKIDDLEARKMKAEAGIRKNIDEQLSNLQTKKEELRKKYELLTTASEEKWVEVKEAFSSASKSFKEGIKTLGDLF